MLNIIRSSKGRFTTQRQNDCACSAFLSGEFAWQCANGRSRKGTRHLFLRSFIIYKDLGASTETLQVTCRKLQTVSDLTSSEISGVKLVFLRPSMPMAGKLNFS